MRTLKLVKVANVRKHMDAHFRGEISYTEAVNRINEDANQALNIANVSNCGGAIPYDRLSDNFKKSIDSIEDNLNK